MKRVVVIGSSCSGKSTLAKEIARRRAIPHIELDALYWEAGWKPVEREEFRRRVAAATQAESWVADGNYSPARDILWPRADTLVWLDLPLHLVLFRLFKRSLGRAFTGAELWNGCRETLQTSLFGRDSLLRWILKTYRTQNQEYERLMKEAPPGRFIRLRSPVAVREFLVS